jgi:plastocyanin
MDKKIIVLLLVLGVILSGCKITEEQTEEPVGIEEQESQELVNETVEEVNQTTEPVVELNDTVDTEEEPGEINVTEPEENVFTIEIDHLTFSQKDVVIEKGTTVVWDNLDSYKHKITVYGVVQSPTLYEGDSFNYTFNEEGKYYFVCAIFKKYTKVGTITVE